MLGAIELIEEFAQQMDYGQYRVDLKSKSAIERQMQIISEAARRLSDASSPICAQPRLEWDDLVGMGDVLRHGYHKISDEIVWRAVQIYLPILKAAAIGELERLPVRNSGDAPLNEQE